MCRSRPPLKVASRSITPTTGRRLRLRGVLVEGLQVVSVSGGRCRDQRVGYQASDGGQLAWTGAKPGDTLELALPMRFRVSARLMKGPEQGIVQFKMNGQALGAPIDLYDPKEQFTELVMLGECSLQATAAQKLTVEIVGANEKSTGRNFGCDYVVFDRVD